MARQQTQVVPLDLRSGCLTNETGFAIGPRLRAAQNVGWQPFRSTSDLRRRSLGFLPMPPAAPLYVLGGGSHNETGHTLGMLFNEANRGVIVTEEIVTGHLLVNREVGGTAIVDTGNALGLSPDFQTAAIADWPSVATPRTYLSHPNLVTPETYQWDGTTFAAYAPAVTPGVTFKGNSSLIVHIDRLWMAKQQKSSAGRPRTLVWYTDPLDPTTVRSTNFVDIPDYVTSMFRASSSPIDVGAQAHLVFGCINSIWVLDGDPTQGNAVLRRLRYGVGVSDASCVAVTPYGAVVLATDGQFYLIPVGAQDMVPIGHGNRDQAQLFDVPSLASARRANASLAWASPYVYYCPDNINACWLLDFSRGATEPAKWWGPLTSFINNGDPWGARRFSAGVEDGRDGSTKIRVGPTELNSAVTPWEIDLTAEQIANRTALLRTGYIQVSNHRVKFGRLVLMTTRKSAAAAITVTAYRADGSSVAKVLQPLTRVTPTKDVVTKTIFAFDALGIASDYFYLEIAWPAGVEPDLQDAWLEFRTAPKAD